MVCFDIFS